MMTMTTTTERDRQETTLVSVGSGWKVLTWMRAAERLGVRISVVDDALLMEPCLPPVAQAFIEAHAAEMRRVVLAIPDAVM